MQTTFESDDLKADLNIKFVSGSEEILIESTIEEHGIVEHNNYRVTMQQLEDDQFSTIFTDLETYETYEDNPVKLQASVVPQLVYIIGGAVIRYTVQKFGFKQILKIGKRTFFSKSRDAAKKAVLNFTDVTIDVGRGKKVYFTKAKMRHILERHHPNYWTGKENKTFFDPDLSVNEIKNIVMTVINHNRFAISKRLNKEDISALAKVNGVEYKVYISKHGKVNTAFPLGK